MTALFTYELYKDILEMFKKSGYDFSKFTMEEADKHGRVFLRHDVDSDFLGTLNMAKVEEENEASAIFFFQPNNDFYNMLSNECITVTEKLADMGHELGLWNGWARGVSIWRLIKSSNSIFLSFQN